jgi:hypothetical protein
MPPALFLYSSASSAAGSEAVARRRSSSGHAAPRVAFTIRLTQLRSLCDRPRSCRRAQLHRVSGLPPPLRPHAGGSRAAWPRRRLCSHDNRRRRRPSQPCVSVTDSSALHVLMTIVMRSAKRLVLEMRRHRRPRRHMRQLYGQMALLCSPAAALLAFALQQDHGVHHAGRIGIAQANADHRRESRASAAIRRRARRDAFPHRLVGASHPGNATRDVSLGLIALAMLLPVGIRTFQQRRIYKDEETLWRARIALNPAS